MNMQINRDTVLSFLAGFILVLTMYIVTAALVFQYRNPTANQMQVLKEFDHVIFLEKLDEYQTH